MNAQREPFVSTTNSCKLCKPLGACLAFRGIEGAVPFLHGSQGCATYMRRYIISHFREPMDIASSSLGEKSAVYGGGPNLKLGLKNILTKYKAKMIGIATTCLTETIGDNTAMFLKEFRDEFSGLIDSHGKPELVSVSTPSYSGAYMEGFHAAVMAIVDQLAIEAEPVERVNLFPGFITPADTRYLKDIMADFGLHATIVPDLSDTLDAPALTEYQKLPSGGAKLEEIKSMGGARATIEFGQAIQQENTPGKCLYNKFGLRLHSLGLPIGLRETDGFFDVLQELAGVGTPEKHLSERGRLVDSYIDGHKYVFGKKAVIYGEEDMITGLTSFLVEVGIKPVLVATGANGKYLRKSIEHVCAGILDELPVIREDVDFYDIGAEAKNLAPDFLIGNSKGHKLSIELSIPLIRVGFPIHDRFGGQRLLTIGYKGAQQLLDTIVNTIIQKNQDSSDIGYGYI